MNNVFNETGESIFSTITRLASKHDAINLGQGFPNFKPPQPLVNEIQQFRDSPPEEHQYAPSDGLPALKQALMKLYQNLYGFHYDADSEVTITTGATEGLASCLYGLLNPGDHVIVFEPVYDLYVPVARRAGADVTAIPMEEPTFDLPIKRLKRVVTRETQLIIVNNPHNPTGRVFSDEQLQEVVNVAEAHDAVILGDEVYEHLFYEGRRSYTPLASLNGARERTIWMGSAGKTFNATGWKIGWALAPPKLTRALRGAHQFTTFCTATPLQYALCRYIQSEDMTDYLQSYRTDYRTRKSILESALQASPFDVVSSEGTYFTTVQVPDSLLDRFDVSGDMELVRALTREVGLAAIPLSSFYVQSQPTNTYLRFAFCKDEQLLKQAVDRLNEL